MSSDPERLERFRCEAQTVAALNHSNIVTIDSAEEAGGSHLLTMERVDGKALDEVIPAGGLLLNRFFELAIPNGRDITAVRPLVLVMAALAGCFLTPATAEVCHSVRLITLETGKKARAVLDEQELADRCSPMPVSGKIAIRCEPSRTLEGARRSLPAYRAVFPDAYVNSSNCRNLELAFPTFATGSSGAATSGKTRSDDPVGDTALRVTPGSGLPNTPVRESEPLTSEPTSVSATAPAVPFPRPENGPPLEVPAVLMPAHLAAPSDDREVSQLTRAAEEERTDYLDTLMSSGSFKGLYGSGGYGQDLERDRTEEIIGLEWEFFEEGWRESRQNLEKKKLQMELQYFQYLRDMRLNELNERLFYLQGLINQTRLYVVEKRARQLEDMLGEYEERLKHGYATRLELQRLAFQRDRARAEATHYRKSDVRGVVQEHLTLINRIELIRLREADDLKDQAVSRSHDHQIQNIFIRRSEFFPRWLDELRVRLYAQKRKLFQLEERDDVIGVRARIPIDFNRKRRQLVDMEKTGYRRQQRALELRIEQRIARLLETLSYHQHRVRWLTNEYALLGDTVAVLDQRARMPLPSLEAVPEKEAEQLTLELLSMEEEILLARLSAYEMLLKLEAVVMPETLEALLAPAD